MTKETKKILEFIETNPDIQDKIINLKQEHKNIREFFNGIGYIIQDIVSINKQFHAMNRKNIDVFTITERYFG